MEKESWRWHHFPRPITHGCHSLITCSHARTRTNTERKGGGEEAGKKGVEGESEAKNGVGKKKLMEKCVCQCWPCQTYPISGFIPVCKNE